jgi:hypothetical protein
MYICFNWIFVENKKEIKRAIRKINVHYYPWYIDNSFEIRLEEQILYETYMCV